jgi:hypothetical protein
MLLPEGACAADLRHCVIPYDDRFDGPDSSWRGTLSWLADVPLFIDEDQVARFYDAIVHPRVVVTKGGRDPTPFGSRGTGVGGAGLPRAKSEIGTFATNGLVRCVSGFGA